MKNTTKQLWERRCGDPTCSRRLTNIQHLCRLLYRFREQARSHISPM
ncbi:hypothetical protein PS710_02640 [Pseudomonas fluorescens]|uniref:Uncharacterized protein n=1 Tax=Pseudomonas fluorescens TaxID=294 RepID=A0A5E7CLK3_PSEFL|nr:hypothetical protein PS710_02640 [Pseudomonas fluorescens]